MKLSNWLTGLLTDSMVHRPSSEAYSSWASQEILRILPNSDVHYWANNSRLLLSFLSQVNPVHAIYYTS